jgi:hypothetical protein
MRNPASLWFHYDARGRRRLAPLTLFAVGVGVFALMAATVFGWHQRRPLRSLAGSIDIGGGVPSGAQHDFIEGERVVNRPTSITWTVSPHRLEDGRTVYHVDQPVVLRAAQEDGLAAWLALSFQNGLPDESALPALLGHFTHEGAGRSKTLDLIAGYRQSAQYWRKSPPAEFAFVEPLAEFSADGAEVQIAIFFPEKSVTNNLIDADTGQVLATQALPAFVVRMLMHYDPFQGRWLVVDGSVSAVSGDLPPGVLWSK